jgi:hypothetical protein
MAHVMLRGPADVSCLPRYIIIYIGNYLLHRILFIFCIGCYSYRTCLAQEGRRREERRRGEERLRGEERWRGLMCC